MLSSSSFLSSYSLLFSIYELSHYSGTGAQVLSWLVANHSLAKKLSTGKAARTHPYLDEMYIVVGKQVLPGCSRSPF
jgi:hypothetical protein